MIPALNTNHTDFRRISTLPNFLLVIPGNGDASTQSDTLVGAVKRQCAEFAALPSNVVLCRCPQRRYNRVPGPATRPRRTNQERAMAESVRGTPSTVRPPDDRLDSWKEIA